MILILGKGSARSHGRGHTGRGGRVVCHEMHAGRVHAGPWNALLFWATICVSREGMGVSSSCDMGGAHVRMQGKESGSESLCAETAVSCARRGMHVDMVKRCLEQSRGPCRVSRGMRLGKYAKSGRGAVVGFSSAWRVRLQMGVSES